MARKQIAFGPISIFSGMLIIRTCNVAVEALLLVRISPIRLQVLSLQLFHLVKGDHGHLYFS
jgi:hypothetical protein